MFPSHKLLGLVENYIPMYIVGYIRLAFPIYHMSSMSLGFTISSFKECLLIIRGTSEVKSYNITLFKVSPVTKFFFILSAAPKT